MIRAVALLACLSACACARPPAPEPIVRTVEVLVPVPTLCRPDIGPAPQYADAPEALRQAADIFDAMKLRAAGRAQRQAREAVLQAALDGCAGEVRP